MANVKNKNNVFLKRRINTQDFGEAIVLDAIASPRDQGRDAKIFFKTGVEIGQIRLGKGMQFTDMRSIGGGAVLSCKSIEPSGKLPLVIAGKPVKIEATPPETDLFKDLNVGFSIRNGETVETVLEWLAYHVKHHGMNAALILNRSHPSKDKQFDNQLKKQTLKIKGLKRLVLLDSKVPLGQIDLPEEAHPFNVPGAPGKDRMEIPKPAPWAAPLGELQIFELARARFLATARAVMNIETYDLIALSDGVNVFDRAVTASTGVIQLNGHQVFPWRVRNNADAKFGDHICRQFDAKGTRARWCVAPSIAGEKTVWRLIRIVGSNPSLREQQDFYRCMALRHPTDTVSKIVPKTSLVEDEGLVDLATKEFKHKPVHLPEEKFKKPKTGDIDTTIVTTMKNEGPFILEWLAYHRVIGVKHFLVYTNDCTDGTDTMLDMLQEKGYVQHRDNPFKGTDLKPQHAALQAADNEGVVKHADWLICMDVDEFIDVKCGDGTLKALYEAVGDSNMISATWRLFGNNDIHEFEDALTIEQYDHCAPELIRKPHQAWGFKTLFRNVGIFKKMGVHRPKGLIPQLWEEIKWVNGSGKSMPQSLFRNGWRSTTNTYGYDLVQLNHYAVRCAESFLVKRDRGRVNHVDRDQGMSYWFRMNNNAEKETSIMRMIPAVRAEMNKMMQDPEIAAAHEFSVKAHRAKIDELRKTEKFSAFYEELINPRLEKLSKLHGNFGANVFLAGPECIPDEIVEKEPGSDFFFTVEKGETTH